MGTEKQIGFSRDEIIDIVKNLAGDKFHIKAEKGVLHIKLIGDSDVKANEERIRQIIREELANYNQPIRSMGNSTPQRV